MLSLLLSRLNCCHEPELDERNLVTISYREEAESDPPQRQEPTRPDREVPVPPLELKVDSLEDPDINTDKEGAEPEEEEVLEVEIGDENLPESKGEFMVREEVGQDHSPAEKGVREAPEEKTLQEGPEEPEDVPVIKNPEMPQEEAQELPSVDDDQFRTSQKGTHIIYQNEEEPKRVILFYRLHMRIDAEETVIM
ncbi:hypothetical protein PRIPAC_94828 [Pristionchus pacificus]|uniref:Uncharacterized protein n=1 Tax=Pristionchus pacificus TaxID=54126 RepID=A0A2A6CDP0_PRIPA|nr:hypothetical protein PRIPAC_94828 [Pristionchus pacificus]|eukprot:PDM76314.1 hypothetical protein PRIPAC_39918 [Pristionchus pacificus]